MRQTRMLAVAAVAVLSAGSFACSDFLTDEPPTVDPSWRATIDDDEQQPADETRKSVDPESLRPNPEPEYRTAPDLPTGRPDLPKSGEFVAHEWGTFTSVVAPNGNYLPGLHHQGVALPSFVHDIQFSGPGATRHLNPDLRGPALPEKVTQKLETPVVYFYSDRPRDVRVQVDFPKGWITKWYPNSVSRTPTQPKCTECSTSRREKHGFDELADGRMTWDVSITNQDESDHMTSVPPDDIWAPSRRVPEAAYVQENGETDKFIFYRGVGRSEPPFTIRASETPEGPKFEFVNKSSERVPNVYLMNIKQNSGRITKIGAVEGGQTVAKNPAPKELGKEKFVEKAKTIVKNGLVDTGLTPTESEAMVETWAHSYFRKTGYRVLYILPRKWTDRMLPIDIEPEPDRLVRTIVGRVEVMTPTVERLTLQRIRQAKADGRSLENIYRGGRFEEPHFRRACRLAQKDSLEKWCETELKRLSAEVIDERGRSGY